MLTPWPVASAAAELFATVLAPPRCAACDARVPMLTAFCRACASTVERAPGGEGISAALVYGGATARAIVRMKYGARPDLARPLGDLLWRAIEPRAAAYSDFVVVPVPLHPSRLAERGFNQSALIARPLARRLRAPFLPLALARVRDTPQQAVLERDARLANVAGAFRVRKPEQVRARRVLLVDDVCTTGATLRAAAFALLDADARAVAYAVVARSLAS